MAKPLELENVLLDQIEKLNDDSIFEDKEAVKNLIERSRAISDLTNSYIDIQRTKLDAQKLKIDTVKIMHETAIGIGNADEGVKKYLGIKEFWITEKPLNPKLDAIRNKYRNGIPQESLDGLANKLTDIYIKELWGRKWTKT